MLKSIQILVLLQLVSLKLHADPNEDLSEAVFRGDATTTAKALADGADVNYAPISNVTPLHTAANHGATEVVKVLLKAGANIEARDIAGRTPLWEAVGNDHAEVVKLLIEAGANLNNSSEGYTLLMWAASWGSKKAAEVLLKHKIPIDAQETTADSAQYGTGMTALMHATTNGKIEVVRLLLSHKANVNLKTSEGWTALKMAIYGKHKDIADLLRAKGGKI